MKNQPAHRIKELLKESLVPLGERPEPARDLWPAMLRRLDEEPMPRPLATAAVPWFDWALAVAVLAVLVASPGLIPVLLYYL